MQQRWNQMDITDVTNDSEDIYGWFCANINNNYASSLPQMFIQVWVCVLISSIWRIWPFSLSEMLTGVVLRACIYKCPYVYISVCVYTVFCKKKK